MGGHAGRKQGHGRGRLTRRLLPLTSNGLRWQSLLGAWLLLRRLRSLLLCRRYLCLRRRLVMLLPVRLRVLLHALQHLRLHGCLVSVCLRHRIHAAAATNTRVTAIHRWQA